jgi:hypothetical protein
MHMLDLRTLMTVVKIAINSPLYSSIIMVNHLSYSPLPYIKSMRHIVLEITTHEEYRWLKNQIFNKTSIGHLKTSLICIKM